MRKKGASIILSYSGQSIVEIVIALGIFVILAASLGSLTLGSLAAQERGSQFTQAQALAQEGLEAVRAIRDRDWDELIYNRSAVGLVGASWVFAGEGTTEEIGNFTRVIDFSPVYREGSYNIVGQGEPGATLDASSTQVTVSVSWKIRSEDIISIERITYLTNWRGL